MQAEFLGDVHLGKRFVNGVPLHRRGDRETMQLEQFRSNLMNTKADLHIQVGDLFDSFQVGNMTVFAAAMIYREASRKNPHTKYIVLRGNHDASRDVDKVSSFQLFKEMVRDAVIVVDERPYQIGKYILIPWHPFKTAEEMVSDGLWDAEIAVGHWDVVMGDTNRIPAKTMLEMGIQRAVTGHDHTKRDTVVDGLPVHVTGSMQPYSHGEDPDGNIYVTVTLQEALESDFTNKCVRVVLQPNEVLDQAIECLQLTIQRMKGDDVELEADFEAFDLNLLFERAREEVGLDEVFGKIVKAKMDECRAS